MRERRRAIYRALVVGAAGAAFAVAGYVGGFAVLDVQHRSQMNDLSALVLHRAETEADFAFTGLSDLVQAGDTGCDASALGGMRRQVYVRSSIKDIRILDGTGHVACSAFPETLSFDTEALSPAASLPARNTSVSLLRVPQASTASLGVLWRASNRTLLAVVNTDALLFGVLPAPVAADARLQLRLADGSSVAVQTSGKAETEAFKAAAISFTAASKRYPLVLSVEIDGAAFRGWASGPLPSIAASAGLLGLAFGALLAWLIVPRKSLVADIDEALAAGEIVPFVQPVVTLATGEVVGCEILARWIRKDGSIVPPSQFIPQVEQSGRAKQLTWTLLRRALEEMKALLRTKPDFTVALNVVPSHMLEAGFSDDLVEIVSASGASPRQIVLEVTERQELGDLARAAEVIATLDRLGFAVAIDDAGTGHSGLSYVQSLGARILKLDKFFVDALETSHSARVVVEMLTGAAQRLRMRLVAEGIEREGQLAQLNEIGIEHGQGYLFGRPVPIAALLADLRKPAAGLDGDRASRETDAAA